MINQFDLNLLTLFEVVARTKSVKNAAAELSVTPSAISQALSRLEEQVGTQLFLREHKKIKISTAGLELQSKTYAPLLSLQKQLNEFRAEVNSKNPAGIISLGCPSEFGSSFMIKWFSVLQKDYPKIKIKLRLGSPQTLLSCLDNGEVDFVIADDGPYYDKLHKSLSIEKMFFEELIMCVSKHLFEKYKLIPSYENLIKLPHLDYSADGSAIGIWYKHYFKRIPRNYELVMISENVRALISGVKNDLGIAMIPKYLVSKELEKGSILQIFPNTKPLLNALLLIQHQSKIPTRVEKIFLEMIRSKKKMLF